MAGETTTLSAANRKLARKNSSTGLTGHPYTAAFSTTQNELNDVMEFGYLPAGVTVVAVLVASTDMDSLTAVVHKVTIGSTDVVTNLTLAQTGTSGCYAVNPPLTTTDRTLLKTTTTTAAGTAVAGSMVITPIYFSA